MGREKDEAENKKFFQQVLDEVQKKVEYLQYCSFVDTSEKLQHLQGAVGTFPKDKFKGKFVDEWNAFLKEADADLDTRDVGAPLAGPLAVKDEEEIVCRLHLIGHAPWHLIIHTFAIS